MTFANNPGHMDCTVIAHRKNVKLVICLVSRRHASARRRKLWGRNTRRRWIAERSVAPMSTADDPCHIDCAVIGGNEGVKLVGRLVRGGETGPSRRERGGCDAGRARITGCTVRPMSIANFPGHIYGTVVADDKGVELVGALLGRREG